MSRLQRIAAWFEERLGFRDSLAPMMDHPIPRRTARRARPDRDTSTGSNACRQD